MSHRPCQNTNCSREIPTDRGKGQGEGVRFCSDRCRVATNQRAYLRRLRAAAEAARMAGVA